MNHYTSPSFWELYENLPDKAKDLARKNFTLLKENPHHPSLHLKKVGRYWSVRIGKRHRALAVQIEEGLLWFWVGTHPEYERMLNRRE